MRLLRLSPLLVVVSAALSAQTPRPGTVVTANIGRFWRVFDKVTATSDTSLQRALIQSQYIDSATQGLRAMMTARRYNAAAHADAIQCYPILWRSVRANTLRAPPLATALEQGITQLRTVYPQLKPAPVYVTIGALRSGGTTLDGQVLIGSELALGDSTVDTSELAPRFANVVAYMRSNPIENVVQLNAHEYVQTQQRPYPYRLLHVSIAEGVAE